eukprot:4051088-Prymnesium_polylepis.1
MGAVVLEIATTVIDKTPRNTFHCATIGGQPHNMLRAVAVCALAVQVSGFAMTPVAGVARPQLAAARRIAPFVMEEAAAAEATP